MNYRLYFHILLFQFLIVSISYGQKKQVFNLDQMLEKNKLICSSKINILTDSVKKGISFNNEKLYGVAWLKDIKFSNGTIEIDLKGKDLFQKSFLGVAFRGVNDTTYDAIYFRPFNFQAEDTARRNHSVQYMSMPQFPWDVLRKKYRGKYEKPILSSPLPNEWFHARIEVKDSKINVYVNNSPSPQLSVTTLNDRKEGSLGVWFDGHADFSNLIIIKD